MRLSRNYLTPDQLNAQHVDAIASLEHFAREQRRSRRNQRLTQFAVILALLILCWPVIYAGLICVYVGVLLACLSFLLIPLNALGDLSANSRSNGRRSRRW